MDELFNNLIANAWDAGLSEIYENPLSYDMIEDSIGRACDFFNIEHSAGIEPDNTTGVGLGDSSTYGDGMLFFNLVQLENMGISVQDGLDLVMAHEGTHIALQDLDTGFNSYQEELCCDYMAGVRAGLNGMDVTQMEDSLINLPSGVEHPVGTFRVDAFEQGVAFADDYMLTHELPPTFNECLEDFKGDYMHDTAHLARLNSEVYTEACTMEHYRHLMEQEPTNESVKEQFHMSEARYHNAMWEYNRWHALSGRDDGQSLGGVGKYDDGIKEFVHKPVDGQHNQSFKGNLYTKTEIDKRKSDAQKEMDYQKSQMEKHAKKAADLASAGKPCNLEKSQYNSAKEKFDNAKSELNRWNNEKPKDK